MEDRAALLVRETSGRTIERNTFQETFFGIYLQKVSDCSVLRNTLDGGTRRQMLGENGIHVGRATAFAWRTTTFTGIATASTSSS